MLLEEVLLEGGGQGGSIPFEIRSRLALEEALVWWRDAVAFSVALCEGAGIEGATGKRKKPWSSGGP